MNQHPTPADIFVACLEQGNEQAWRLFVQTFQPLIASSVSRVVSRYIPLNLALVDDLVQETFLRFCRQDAHVLRRFESRHESAIFGYIRVIATSVALDHFRARSAQKRAAEVPREESTPESQVRPATIENTALINELDRRLAESESERDRAIFWLYYRQGYSAREIAALPGIGLTQKGIESCIYRLAQLLRAFVGSSLPSFKKVEGNPRQTALGEMK